MTSEVCPFCGKTFKRLKSHLPHCKAAVKSTPPTTHDVAAAQKPSSHLASAFSKTTSKGQKTKEISKAIDLPPEGNDEGCLLSIKPVSLATSTNGLSSLSGFASSSKKKKTQTLAEQIKTEVGSTSPASPLAFTFSKPKKKSLRALIEEAKSDHIAKEALKGTGSALKDLSLNKTSDQTEFKAVSTKVKDFLSNVNKNNTSARRVRENFWEADEGETTEGPVKPVSANQTRVTLQDVKATLGRATGHQRSGPPSILSRIAAAEDPNGQIKPSPDSLYAENKKRAEKHLATPAAHSEKKLSTEKQPCNLQLSPKCKLPQQEADRQPEPSSSRAGVHRGTSPLGLNAGLKADPHSGLSAPVNQNPSQLLSPPNIVKDLHLDVRKKNVPDKSLEGFLTERSLSEVRLKDLSDWLTSRKPSRPKDVVEMVQRGWLWYYRKYIDVKKGGVGGVGMLLAGYCVLGYIWSYPYIKLNRWRKYH